MMKLFQQSLFIFLSFCLASECSKKTVDIRLVYDGKGKTRSKSLQSSERQYLSPSNSLHEQYGGPPRLPKRKVSDQARVSKFVLGKRKDSRPHASFGKFTTATKSKIVKRGNFFADETIYKQDVPAVASYDWLSSNNEEPVASPSRQSANPSGSPQYQTQYASPPSPPQYQSHYRNPPGASGSSGSQTQYGNTGSSSGSSQQTQHGKSGSSAQKSSGTYSNQHSQSGKSGNSPQYATVGQFDIKQSPSSNPSPPPAPSPPAKETNKFFADENIYKQDVPSAPSNWLWEQASEREMREHQKEVEENIAETRRREKEVQAKLLEKEAEKVRKYQQELERQKVEELEKKLQEAEQKRLLEKRKLEQFEQSEKERRLEEQIKEVERKRKIEALERLEKENLRILEDLHKKEHESALTDRKEYTRGHKHDGLEAIPETAALEQEPPTGQSNGWFNNKYFPFGKSCAKKFHSIEFLIMALYIFLNL